MALFITAFGPVYHAMPACKPTLLLAGEHPAHPANQRRVVCGGELAPLGPMAVRPALFRHTGRKKWRPVRRSSTLVTGASWQGRRTLACRPDRQRVQLLVGEPCSGPTACLSCSMRR